MFLSINDIGLIFIIKKKKKKKKKRKRSHVKSRRKLDRPSWSKSVHYTRFSIMLRQFHSFVCPKIIFFFTFHYMRVSNLSTRPRSGNNRKLRQCRQQQQKKRKKKALVIEIWKKKNTTNIRVYTFKVRKKKHFKNGWFTGKL